MDAFLAHRCAFTSLEKKEERETAVAAVLYFFLLFRGQQRSGFDRAAFISKRV